MKKILMLSAALAIVASPVLAASRDYSGTYVGSPTFKYDPSLKASGPTSNNLSSASYTLTGNAAVFCQLDTADASNRAVGTNVTITTNNGTASGTVAIDQFQGPNDFANAWFSHIDLSNSIGATALRFDRRGAGGFAAAQCGKALPYRCATFVPRLCRQRLRGNFVDRAA